MEATGAAAVVRTDARAALRRFLPLRWGCSCLVRAAVRSSLRWERSGQVRRSRAVGDIAISSSHFAFENVLDIFRFVGF